MISFPSSPLYPAGMPFPAQINKPANLPLYPLPQPTQLPFSPPQPQGETFNFSTPVAPQALPSTASSFQTQGSNLPTQTPSLQPQEVPVTPEPGLPSTTNGWLLPALGVGAAATLAGGLIYRARSSNKKQETSAPEADTSTATAEKTVNQSETDIHTAKSTVSKSTAAHQAETDTAKAERDLAKSGIAAKAINKTKVISSTIFGTAASGLAAYSGWLPGFRAASSTIPTAATRITKDISNIYPDIFSVKPASVVAQEAMKPGHNFAASAFRQFAGIAQSPTIQSFAGRSTLYGAAGVGLGLGMYFYQRNAAIRKWAKAKEQEWDEQSKKDFAIEVNQKDEVTAEIKNLDEKIKINESNAPEKKLYEHKSKYRKKELEYLEAALYAKKMRAMSEEAEQAAIDHPDQQKEFERLAKNYEKKMNKASKKAEEAQKETDDLKNKWDFEKSISECKKGLLKNPLKDKMENPLTIENRRTIENQQTAIDLLKEFNMQNIPKHPAEVHDFVQSNYKAIIRAYKKWHTENHPDALRGEALEKMMNNPEQAAKNKVFNNNYSSLLKPVIANLERKAGLVEELKKSGFSEEQIAQKLDPER